MLEAIQHDLRNTIFSFIPNTAETAFYGMLKGMEQYLNRIKVERILSWGKDFDEEKLREMINRTIRIEKNCHQGCKDAYVYYRRCKS